jgi:CheY-like chemotaxis protein
MNVLVADDDETIRALVTMLFSRRGDNVKSAADGAEAVRLLDRNKFDLLVLDLMMPRVDGLAVLAHLRNRSVPAPRTVVITAAVSALTDAVPRDQVVAVLSKPFDIQSLLRIADDAETKSATP